MKLQRLAWMLPLAASAAFADDAPPGERVEIVGSRVPRVDAETALPVQVIRRDEIERSGALGAEQLLERISANFGGHPEALGLGDADTPGFSGASLRGLGAAETLVLLNGRRLANYAFTSTTGPGVDLHVIPLAAIERVEVLKDGASALYGSDAIGGVINFVTRNDYAGGEAGLALSRPEAHGGGTRTRATLATGGGDERYNIFGVLDLQRASALSAADRAFAASGYRPELSLDGTVRTSWPANFTYVLPDGSRSPLINPAAPACTPDTVNKGQACWFDYAKTLQLLPASQQLDAFGRGTLALAPELDAYAELLLSDSRVRFAISPTPASMVTAPPGFPFVLHPDSPYYPGSPGVSGDLTLSYRTLPLGPRSSEVHSRNTRLLVGAKGSVQGWELDGALALNDTVARERYLSGYVGAKELSQALGTGLVNPFGESGPEGNALLAATQLMGPSRTARGRTDTADLRATRDLSRLPGGPLGLAAGAEVRHETLTDVHMDIVADVVGGAPSGPKSGARNAQAAYLELVAPFARGFELQAAARLDRYSDFGTALNPKLALRWQPHRDWIVRASVGRGFRAPSLPELYTQQQQSVNQLDVPDPVRCPVTGLDTDCAPEVLLVSGGNPALQPQHSTQANAGIVVEPAAGWLVSLDAWSIRVRDLIGVLDGDEVFNHLERYDGRFVHRGPPDPATPGLPGPITSIDLVNENLGDWHVGGFDLSVSMKPVPTPLGRLSMSLAGTYVARSRQEIFEGNVVSLVGRLAPRWQQVLSATLERGSWSATLANRYRRGYLDDTPLPDGSLHRVASTHVWDGQLAWAATGNLQLTLGVRNLADSTPAATNQAVQFQAGYDPLYADPLGRTWTVGLRATWQ